MCHLVLLMPLFGLAVFWIFPLSVALPLYLFIFAVSAFVYFALLKAMQQPVTTGREGLIGEIGRITSSKNHNGYVAIHGEIWAAEIKDNLGKGEKAEVTGMNGLKLQVQKPGQKGKSAKHCAV